MTVTLISWVCWGWGNATDRLVEAFAAVERARGFQPLSFVDAQAAAAGCRHTGVIQRREESAPLLHRRIRRFQGRCDGTGGTAR